MFTFSFEDGKAKNMSVNSKCMWCVSVHMCMCMYSVCMCMYQELCTISTIEQV